MPFGAKLPEDVLEPGVVGVTDGRGAVFPAGVFLDALAAPIRDVERRIGEDEVEALVAPFVLVKAAFVVPGDAAGVDAAHREVHLGETPGGVIAFLPIDSEVADATAMRLQEAFGLNEHAAGAAAGVINPAFNPFGGVGEGFEHLHQHPDHGARCIELSASLAFRPGKPAEEILVHAPQKVAGLSRFLMHGDTRKQVNQLAQHDLIERRPIVILRQNAFQRGVGSFDQSHSVVDKLADGRQLGVGLQVRPARFLGNPEDVFSQVFVLILGRGTGLLRAVQRA